MMRKFKPTPLAGGVRSALLGSGTAVAMLVTAAPAQAGHAPGHPTKGVAASGYVKFDAIYDADHDLGDSLNATAVPVGDADTDDGTVRFHARQSRFRLNFHDDEAMVNGRIGINLDWGGENNAKTTIVYGVTQSDDEHEDLIGGAETISTWHANYRWSPYKLVDLGLEISVADREDFGGEDGDNTRAQFGATYSF